MKILFYRYGSICEEDVIEAFNEYGIETKEILEEVYNKQLLPSDCVRILKTALDKDNYSFVFSINFFPTVSDVCNIYHIPYMCLIVDSPVLELYSESIRNPYNRIFLFDRALYNEFHSYNPDCIFHIPLATNVNRWDRVIAADTSKRFTCDISFVGSLYTEKSPLKLDNATDYIKGYVDGLVEAQLKIYGYYFIDNLLTEELAEEILNQMPTHYVFLDKYRADNKALVSQLYIGSRISAEERLRVFHLLSQKYNVDIYTGSDTTSLPKLHNRGLAKTHTEMPLIFNRTGINLNITSKPIRSGIPLRVFDVIGCGGFLITNYQTELPEFFSIGEHLEAYDSMEDLDNKVQFYLEHPQIRQEIARNGYEYVKANHTYTIRIGQMISLAFGQKEVH